MREVSTFRLYLLRATYLLLVVGLAFDQWGALITHPDTWPHMRGVVASVLTAVSLLAVLGLRHPLAMLPLLFFELLWKSIWLAAIALPLARGKGLSPSFADTAWSCALGLVVFSVAIPWRYAWACYGMERGDRWK
jgi:hypothetical protein